MQQFLFLVLVLPALVAATTIRRLEDAGYYGENSYFKFAKCMRVKISQDNDDDGNAYFYNGAYRSQTIAYASYVKCDKGCGSSCDLTTAYVAELDGAIEQALEYSEGYCNACSNNCRRRLDEEEEEQNGQNFDVNCNTCSKECTYLNGGGSNGNDEAGYLECQYSYTDDDGLDFYSAPTCSAEGMLVMGLFYDDECTIKKSDDDASGFSEQFSYNSFHTMESVCMNCQDGICEEVADDATVCQDGKTANGEDDEMGVCKAYKRLSKEWQYAKAKKKSKVPVFLFAFILLSMCSFLTYTYYVRHKYGNTGSTKTALLEAGKETTQTQGASSGHYVQNHS